MSQSLLFARFSSRSYAILSNPVKSSLRLDSPCHHWLGITAIFALCSPCAIVVSMNFPTLPAKTLVAADNSSVLTNLGAIRRACADKAVREDLRAFLEKLKDYSDDLAVYMDQSGPKLVADDKDQALQWVKR